MDGNNRWAVRNNTDRYLSYTKGFKKLLDISNYIFKFHDIKYVSAFALSSNNLNRPKSFHKLIYKLTDYCMNYIDKNTNEFAIKFIGDLYFLPKKTLDIIKQIENKKTISKKTLILFVNYSGKNDVIQASLNAGKNNLNKYKFHNFLLTKNFVDPDILIRTGGFRRISDFMLYQLSFTELFFIKCLWPDITKKHIDKIINNFYKIERKFGI